MEVRVDRLRISQGKLVHVRKRTRLPFLCINGYIKRGWVGSRVIKKNIDTKIQRLKQMKSYKLKMN